MALHSTRNEQPSFATWLIDRSTVNELPSNDISRLTLHLQGITHELSLNQLLVSIVEYKYAHSR